MKQISMQEVAANRAGIAFGTVKDVLQFLHEGKSLSMDGLCVLTTTPIPPESHGLLPLVAIRFPALYCPASEAILVEGSMVQLGDSNVQRKAAQVVAQADHIPTTTIKITVHRDEWPGEWEVFGQAPLREVINKFPMFRLCKGNRCGGECGRYHAPVDVEMDSVIIDIWSRLWQTLKGHKSSQANADVFQALMRIPEICFKHLHQISGNAGVYIEPRQENGKGPDPQFAVIWLPGGKLSDAVHRQKTMDKVHAICRFGTRYGLRVWAKDAEATHGLIAPEETYHNFVVQKVYEIRPLAHGIQKAGVDKLLKAWGWEAKPLQPYKADQYGIGWLIGTAKEPPSMVLRAGDQDITVCIHKDVTQKKAGPTCLSTMKTKAHIQRKPRSDARSSKDQSTTEGTKGEDPWLRRDPWENWSKARPVEDEVMHPTSKIDEVETRLQSQVSGAIATEVSKATEERFQQISVDMAELKQQQAKFDGWFIEAAQLNTSTQGQITQLRQQVQAQQGELGQVKNELGQVRTDIQSGFANIEALLNKKHRTE